MKLKLKTIANWGIYIEPNLTGIMNHGYKIHEKRLNLVSSPSNLNLRVVKFNLGKEFFERNFNIKIEYLNWNIIRKIKPELITWTKTKTRKLNWNYNLKLNLNSQNYKNFLKSYTNAREKRRRIDLWILVPYKDSYGLYLY